jgi:cell division septum initiation protein DivIVA
MNEGEPWNSPFSDEIERLEKEIERLKDQVSALTVVRDHNANSIFDLARENTALKAENILLNAHAKEWGLKAQEAQAQVEQLQWVLEDMNKP